MAWTDVLGGAALQGLKQIWGKEGIGVEGTWGGLRDIGLTENLPLSGSTWQNPLVPWASAAEPKPQERVVTPAVELSGYGGVGYPSAPSGTGTGGGGGGTPTPQAPASERQNAESVIRAMDAGQIQWDDTLRAQMNNILRQGETTAYTGPSEEDKSGVIASIKDKYASLYAELDRRLGLLPEQTAELGKSVAETLAFLKEQARVGGEKVKGEITGAIGKETGRAAQTLRELAQTGGRLFEVAGRTMGASSAIPAVTAAIGGRLAQEGSKILQQRDEILGDLTQKSVDLANAMESKNQELDLWKTNEMTKISQEMRQLQNEINAQKVGADQAKATELSNFEVQLFQNAQQRLLDLDRMVNEQKYALDTYAKQKQIDLNTWTQQLQAYGQYTPGEYNIENLSPTQVQALADSSGQAIQYRGYMIYPKKTEEDTWDILNQPTYFQPSG